MYFILFSIKTLAAIFNKTANGQVPQSSFSNQILCGRVLGFSCCSVIKLAPVVMATDVAVAIAAATAAAADVHVTAAVAAAAAESCRYRKVGGVGGVGVVPCRTSP